MAKTISMRDKAFVDIYLSNGYNTRDAYNQTHPNASKETAHAQGPLILKKPEVKEYLDARRKELFDSQNIDAMRVLEEIAKIAFIGIGSNENVATKEKLKALEMIQKQLGLYDTKLKVEADVTNKVQIIDDYGI